MDIVTFFAGPLGRWLIVGLLMAGAAAFGATKMHQHDQVKYEKLEKEYANFEGGVRALGVQAAADVKAKEAKDKKAKEIADEENARRRADDQRTIAQLRLAAAALDSRGGSTGQGPAGSKCPDGQTCFDRDLYQRAMGAADQGARRLADEGTSVTEDLNTAKKWAKP